MVYHFYFSLFLSFSLPLIITNDICFLAHWKTEEKNRTNFPIYSQLNTHFVRLKNGDFSIRNKRAKTDIPIRSSWFIDSNTNQISIDLIFSHDIPCSTTKIGIFDWKILPIQARGSQTKSHDRLMEYDTWNKDFCCRMLLRNLNKFLNEAVIYCHFQLIGCDIRLNSPWLGQIEKKKTSYLWHVIDTGCFVIVARVMSLIY